VELVAGWLHMMTIIMIHGGPFRRPQFPRNFRCE
jgi:hypothetical protein